MLSPLRRAVDTSRVRNLVKRYGRFTAVRRVDERSPRADSRVPGPNGAGKNNALHHCLFEADSRAHPVNGKPRARARGASGLGFIPDRQFSTEAPASEFLRFQPAYA